MSRRKAREIIFVCSSVSDNGELISQMIPSKTPEEAASLFKDQHALNAKSVLGPFYKKKTQVLETTRSIQLAGTPFRKAEYNGWVVHSFALKEPANQAYLVFIRRVDDKKIPTPKGTITVPLSDLRFQE
jgi:hypothetical protein